MRRVLVCCLLAFFMLGMASSAQLRAQHIEREVWSPYCPGRLLGECTTKQADALRSNILARVRRGQSDAHIYDWLRANYGEDVLARPRTSGSGLIVWLIPLAVLTGGALLWARALRRWRAAAARVETPPDDEWVRRVRSDVQKGQ